MVGTMENSAGFSVSVSGGTCAVYLLLRGREVVYVGQSKNYFSRIAQHVQGMNRKRKGLRGRYAGDVRDSDIPIFDSVRVVFCERHKLDATELEYIQLHMPRSNVAQKAQPVLNVSIASDPAILELLEKPEPLIPRRRHFSNAAHEAERYFRKNRDRRERITLPRINFLEREVA